MASAIAARNPRLREAVLADAGRAAPPEGVDDAVAAAAKQRVEVKGKMVNVPNAKG